MKKTKQYQLLIILLAFACVGKAQVKNNFYPILRTSNIKEKVAATAFNNSHQYVITEEFKTINSKLVNIRRIYKFKNGQYNTIFIKTAASQSKVLTAEIFNDELYLGGYYLKDSNTCLVKLKQDRLSNNSLTKVGNFSAEKQSTLKVNSLKVYNKELYIGGSFNELNDLTTKDKDALNLVSFNGKEWKRNILSSNNGIIGKVFKLKTDGVKLYAIGRFYNIWYLINNKWAKLLTVSKTQFSHIAFLKNEVYVYGDSTLYTIRGGQNTSQSIPQKFLKISDMRTNPIDGKLWISALYPRKQIFTWDGTNNLSAIQTNIEGILKFHIINKVFLASAVNSIRIDQLFKVKLYKPLLSRYLGDLAVIRGKVFIDKTPNCKFDKFEKPAFNFIQFNANNSAKAFRLIKPDRFGYFQLFVKGGNKYTLKPKVKEYQKTCPLDSFKLEEGGIKTVLIPIQFLNRPDLSVKFNAYNGSKALLSKRSAYLLQAINQGSHVERGTLTLNYNSDLTNVTAIPGPNRINKGKLEWDFNNLELESTFDVKLTMDVTNFKTKDSLIFEASVNSYNKDANTENDNSSMSQEVVLTSSAVAKYIYPAPLNGASTTIIDSTGDLISYQITFENTSNDTIRYIEVHDTLDINLGMEYIKRTGGSHPHSVESHVNPNNREQAILIWKFNNINLPPKSGNNEQTNHRGFLTFDVKMDPKTTVGTVVTNIADVKMDYTHLITNPVYFQYDNAVSLEKPISIKEILKIYPCPADNKLFIKKLYGKNLILNLLDIQGRLIDTFKIDTDFTQVSTQNYQSGTYLLQIKGLKVPVNTRIIIKH